WCGPAGTGDKAKPTWEVGKDESAALARIPENGGSMVIRRPGARETQDLRVGTAEHPHEIAGAGFGEGHLKRRSVGAAGETMAGATFVHAPGDGESQEQGEDHQKREDRESSPGGW